MSKGPIILKPACIKTLAAVEANTDRSNQHEFNGVAALKEIFGTEKAEFKAVFSVRGEDGSCESGVTWYDSREVNPIRSEHRLYFQTNPVMQRAQEGDNVVIGFIDNQLHCILITNAAKCYPGWTSAPS